MRPARSNPSLRFLPAILYSNGATNSNVASWCAQVDPFSQNAKLLTSACAPPLVTRTKPDCGSTLALQGAAAADAGSRAAASSRKRRFIRAPQAWRTFSEVVEDRTYDRRLGDGHAVRHALHAPGAAGVLADHDQRRTGAHRDGLGV